MEKGRGGGAWRKSGEGEEKGRAAVIEAREMCMREGRWEEKNRMYGGNRGGERERWRERWREAWPKK